MHKTQLRSLVKFESAQVVNIQSARTRQPQAMQAPQQTYKAYVGLNRQTLLAPDSQALKLTAGMAVVVEIHQGRRSVMEYLLSPVQKVSQEAGRER